MTLLIESPNCSYRKDLKMGWDYFKIEGFVRTPWREAQDVGRKRDKCAGSGSV